MKTIPQFLFRPHLDPGEEIIDVFHRHPFIMIPGLARILFFGYFIPLFLYYLFPNFILFFSLLFLIGFIRLIYFIFNWYHDAILLTNVSLNKVGWNGFFDRSAARLEYPMIDGLSYSIRGLRRTIFNYGDITIGLSGGGSAITLKDAINPSKVERVLMGYKEKFVTDQSMKDSESLKTLLTAMLRHHAKTQGTSSDQSKDKNK